MNNVVYGVLRIGIGGRGFGTGFSGIRVQLRPARILFTIDRKTGRRSSILLDCKENDLSQTSLATAAQSLPWTVGRDPCMLRVAPHLLFHG